VTYLTTTGNAGEWSHYTGEQEDTQRQLLELGVEIRVSTALAGFDGEAVTLGCVFSGRQWQQSAASVVLVTSREPCEELYRELVGEEPGASALKIQRIGDCRQPALIAHAVFSGHKAGRELDEVQQSARAKRDRSVIHGD
jgi:dimethylamine/trimethylamine dehydrogenase